MTTLILFDPTFAPQEQVAETCACLMAAHERVRLIQVGQIVPHDLDNVTYFVMACPEQRFSHRMQSALDDSTHAGMRTMTMPDMQRMMWFRERGLPQRRAIDSLG